MARIARTIDLLGRGALLAAMLLATTGIAEAQASAHRLEWTYHRAGVGMHVAYGALVVGTAFSRVFFRPSDPYAGWTPRREDRLAGRLAERPTTRRRLRIASRLLAWSTTVQVGLVDAGLVTWAGDRNGDVAGELFALDGLALAATSFASSLLAPSVRRPRPYYDLCLGDPAYDPGCDRTDRVRSMVDARITLAFTSAALTCTHHAHLPLYGARAADRSACAGAMLFATSSALLAFFADQQHPTDLLVAALIGVLSGFVLPNVVGYGFGSNG